MNNRRSISVAVPWSLSHYIPLNGFHPLYRALFDHAPASVILSAWDNVKLHRLLRSDATVREALAWRVSGEKRRTDRLSDNSVARKYQEFFWPPNQVLTDALPGDVEFHHTVPFPSLNRPFVFHCEIFASLLVPFAGQVNGNNENTLAEIKEFYRAILANPLCLGICSHVPETLEAMRLCFADPNIDRKLFRSRIGLSANAVVDSVLPEKPSLRRPRFLFVNSACQNPTDAFRTGVHIVLRFWKDFLVDGRAGILMLCCARPSEEELIAHGVDVPMVRSETGRSIIWVKDYQANHEVNALMAGAHFFLLPSASLHSVSIMQAMLMGATPVVTDTVGTSVYVTDHETGIVLNGMRAAMWREDEETGILVDRYSRMPDLDDSLVAQLSSRVGRLLDTPAAYNKMRDCAIAQAKKEFSGETFSNHFWSAVSDLCQCDMRSSVYSGTVPSQVEESLRDCIVQGEGEGWTRVFESPTQPIVRIDCAHGAVVEWGGAMVHASGTAGLALHEWSVVPQHYKPGAPQMTFAYTLEELEGVYLHGCILQSLKGSSPTLFKWIARILKPFPWLYGVLSRLRRGLRWVQSRMLGPKIDDIELIWEGVSGYNLVCCNNRFYAIPQSEGIFIPHKAETGGYSSCFSDDSVEKVLQLIAEQRVSRTQSGAGLSGSGSERY